MLKHVIDIGWTSVHPSVRLSVRPSHAGIVSKRLNILSCFLVSSPHDSPFILVLCISRSSRTSDGVPPRAAKQRWGIFFNILCACMRRNDVIFTSGSKYVSMNILSDVDVQLMDIFFCANYQHLRCFGFTFTAHLQKRSLISFR